MNKKISTLLAGILLATTGAFADPSGTAPSALKDGDVMFIKNSGTGGDATQFPTADGGTYLKLAAGGKSIIPVAVATANLDTKAKIDSVSWKVSTRQNASGEIDYVLSNVANSVVQLSFNAPVKAVDPSAGASEITLYNTTDSAIISTKATYWDLSVNNGSDGYSIAYKYKGEAVDTIVTLGVFRCTNTSLAGGYNDYSLRVAKIPFNTDFKTTVKKVEDADANCSDYSHWTFEVDAVDAAQKAIVEMTYADLKSPVIRSTNIPGLANFKVVPVSYNAGVISEPADADAATQFMFLPSDQIGKENPKYYSIDTLRYTLAGTHADNVFGYGIGKDIKRTSDLKNGLMVFSIMYEVGTPDSLIFRPASIVNYDDAEEYDYKVAENPEGRFEADGKYNYVTGEVVIGMAQLAEKTLVSTVFAKEDERIEGKLVPFSFATPVYPEVTPGAYFLQSKNAASMDKYVVVDPCKVVEMTNPNGLDLVSNEPTADRSYNVWMVSVDDSKVVTIENRRTEAEWGTPGQVFEVQDAAGNKYLSYDGIDTFKLVPAEVKEGAVDFAELKDIEYRRFAMSLVNSIGANIYVVKNSTDSLLSVVAEDKSLELVIAKGTETKYGVDDKLTATSYTFTTVIDKKTYKLGLNADSKLILSADASVNAAEFYFENGTKEGQYFVHATTMDGAYLKVYATDNYIKAENAGDCTAGQDQFSFELLNAPKYLTLDKADHYTIKTVDRGDMLTLTQTVNDSSAVFRRPAADGLKVDGYSEDAFKLWIDTAAFNGGVEKLNVPTYFILSGAENIKGTEGAVDTLCGNFLNVAGDSVAFTSVKRIGDKESLIMYPGTAMETAIVKSDASKYQFQFPLVDPEAEDDQVYVQNVNNKKYLAIYNEAIIMVGEADRLAGKAIKVTVNAAETAPTNNADIDEVSGINVVAGKGTVTIQNAAGKKVAITNILGQVIATSVISSDNATISVPAGVAIISVDGEESAKAIVK